MRFTQTTTRIHFVASYSLHTRAKLGCPNPPPFDIERSGRFRSSVGVIEETEARSPAAGQACQTAASGTLQGGQNFPYNRRQTERGLREVVATVLQFLDEISKGLRWLHHGHFRRKAAAACLEDGRRCQCDARIDQDNASVGKFGTRLQDFSHTAYIDRIADQTGRNISAKTKPNLLEVDCGCINAP